MREAPGRAPGERATAAYPSLRGGFAPHTHVTPPFFYPRYRKAFTLPPAAAGQLVALTFDGVWRAADVYVNGAFVRHHIEGYTSFVAWLHNTSAPLHTDGVTPNIVAVYVDGTQSELWSYEQAGIFRHVWLETAPPVSVVPWGFAAPAYVAGAINGGPESPQSAANVTLLPQVDVANAGAAPVSGTATFSLRDAGGALVCSGAVPFSVASGGWVRLTASFPCGTAAAPVNLWNTAPGGAYLHTASVDLVDASGEALDTVRARVGIRRAVFTPDTGFELNGFRIVLKGFS